MDNAYQRRRHDYGDFSNWNTTVVKGLNFGIDTFGVSSNDKDAYEHFGLTAD